MKKIIRMTLPFIVLFVGASLTYIMIKSAKQAKHEHVKRQSYLVRVIKTQKKDQVVYIRTQAEAKTSSPLPVVPQVGGKVIWMKKGLTEGSPIYKGDVLFKIDQSDYKIALTQRKAQLSQAELQLEQAKAQATLALAGVQAVKSLRITQDTKVSALALNEPQVKAAKIAVMSAKAAIAQAQLSLSRTVIKAPFNGYIQDIKIAPGQILGVGSVIGTLYPSSPMYVTASLPLADLEYITSEEENKALASHVMLTKKTQYRQYKWQGVVVRKMQRMEQAGRMLDVYIRVDNVKTEQGEKLPLNMFLDVVISGKVLYNVMAIPYYTMRQNNVVWVRTKDNKLGFKTIKPLYSGNNQVFFREGLEDGAEVITTDLTPAVEGEDITVVK